MSESTAPNPPEPVDSTMTRKAEATLATKMVTPLDDLSRVSIGEVAEAAAMIARGKAEAAAKAAAAARDALARLAALKEAAAAAPAVKPLVAAKTLPIDRAPDALPAQVVPMPIVAMPTPMPAAGPVLVPAKEPAPVEPPRLAEAPNLAEAPKLESAGPPPDSYPVIDPVAVGRVKPKPVVRAAKAVAPSPQEPVVAEFAKPQEKLAQMSPAEREARERAAKQARAEDRKISLGHREDDPSTIMRLVRKVVATSSARSTERRGITHSSPAKAPGAVLEPEAHVAGHGPAHHRAQRKIVTPKLVLLFALMIAFGMYATGNLPQFDQWTDSVVNKAHANNDAVVGTITGSWHAIAFGVVALLLLGIVLVVGNTMRARSNEAYETSLDD